MLHDHYSGLVHSLLQLSHDDGRDDEDWGREEEPSPSSLNNGLGGDRIGNGNATFVNDKM